MSNYRAVPIGRRFILEKIYSRPDINTKPLCESHFPPT